MLTSSGAGGHGGLHCSLGLCCTPGRHPDGVSISTLLCARIAAAHLRLWALNVACFGFHSLMPASGPASFLAASRVTHTILHTMLGSLHCCAARYCSTTHHLMCISRGVPRESP